MARKYTEKYKEDQKKLKALAKALSTKTKRTKAVIKARRSAPQMGGMFGKNPFAYRRKCVLTYSHANVVHATTDQNDSNFFGAEVSWFLNNLNDPFTAAPNIGTHNAALGFHNMMQIYEKYKVTKVTITVTFSDPDVDGGWVGCKISTVRDHAALGGMSLQLARVQPNIWMKPLNNTGKQTVQYKGTFPIHTLACLSKLQFEADRSNDYTGGTAIALNPQISPILRVAYCNPVVAAPQNPQQPPVKVQYLVRLDFHTTFYQRNPLQLTVPLP